MSQFTIWWFIDKGSEGGEWEDGTIELEMDYAGLPSPHIELTIDGQKGYVPMHEFFRALGEQYDAPSDNPG